MLVRGAVLAAGQGYPLTRRALAGARVATKWAPVEGHARAGLALDVFACKLDVTLDHPVHPHLRVDGEERPDVVEERLGRLREVVPIGGEPLHRGLARAQELL